MMGGIRVPGRTGRATMEEWDPEDPWEWGNGGNDGVPAQRAGGPWE